jgi:L-asparaginase II
MDAPVLVEVTRDPLVESYHRGHIAVADKEAHLQHHLGDPNILVCMRSLAKPFQALPVLTSGAAAAFGFGPEVLALFSGSLNGQDFQVELVTQVLSRLGLTPEALQCGAHPPLHRPTSKALQKEGVRPTALHHTCSGKHTAMLALCVHHGWPTTDYLDLDHPVQRLILNTVAEFVGMAPEQIVVAIDGCTAPVFYVPLKNIAAGYAKLAAAPQGTPTAALYEAILAHPRHIAGDERLDTEIMQALPGAIFAKTGGEGGFALSVTKGGLGIGIKIDDGNLRALNPTVIESLDQLELLTPEAREKLDHYRKSPIHNFRKIKVGEIRPVFSLTG